VIVDVQQQLDLFFFLVSCFCLFKANLVGFVAPVLPGVSPPVILDGLEKVNVYDLLQYCVILEHGLF
jgi:hypothetical protein